MVPAGERRAGDEALTPSSLAGISEDFGILPCSGRKPDARKLFLVITVRINILNASQRWQILSARRRRRKVSDRTVAPLRCTPISVLCSRARRRSRDGKA